MNRTRDHDNRAGSSTTFTVTFTPTAAVAFNDTLTITSDDPDSFENPYMISLGGTGTVLTPDINLQVERFDRPSG